MHFENSLNTVCVADTSDEWHHGDIILSVSVFVQILNYS